MTMLASPAVSDDRPTQEAKVYDVAGNIRSYALVLGETPALLRRIADDIERDEAVLVGLWVVGFGRPDELVIQVITDVAPEVPGE